MRDISVHNVGFYKPTPNTISHLAVNKDKLALARIDATIEIWNIKDTPYIEKTITSSIENQTMQGLTWLKNRLFSTGGSGFLLEYDLHSLCVKTKTSLTGQAALCMDAHSKTSKIAVGTELGYINIFDAEEGDLLFHKLSLKQDTRILCLKYDKSGKHIATGLENYVIIYNAENAKVLHKLSVQRQKKNQNIYVWCITITSDLTVITGDSSGTLCFWDGKLGSLIYSYKSHKADILTMCLSNKEGTVYCSGIDKKIVSFVNVEVKNNMQWVRSKEENYHSNIVMALRIVKNKIYSGGITGYLFSQVIDQPNYQSYPPLLQGKCAEVKNNGLIMLRHPKKLEIWNLGKLSKTNDELDEIPKKNIVIQRQVLDHNKKDVAEGIIAAALSNNGRWIAFSTQTVFRLLSYESGIDEPSLVSTELPDQCDVSLHALFTPNSEQLILIKQNGDLQLLSLKDKNPILLSTIQTIKQHEDTITIIRISPNAKYLITANPESVITVWEITTEIKYVFNLPKYTRPPLDIAFNSSSNFVAILYSDSKIVEYDIIGRKTISTIDGKRLKNKSFKNISYDPMNEEMIVFHNNFAIYIYERKIKTGSTNKQGAAKIAKTNDENSTEQAFLEHKNTVRREKYLVHMEWLSNNELVAVQVPPIAFLGTPYIDPNKFGTK